MALQVTLSSLQPLLNRQPWWIKSLLVCVLCLAMVHLGMLLAAPPGYVTTVWPPAGLGVATVLLWRWAAVLGLFMGTMTMALVFAYMESAWSGWLTVVPVAVGACVQALFGSWLVRRFVAMPSSMIHMRDISLFALLAGPVASALGASIGVAVLLINGLIEPDQWLLRWFVWWAANVVGVLVFAPLILVLAADVEANPWTRRLQVCLPMVMVFLLAVGLFQWSLYAERQRVYGGLRERALETAEKLERRLEQAAAGVGSIKGFYAASGQVGRAEFEHFFQQLIPFTPGLEIAVWMEPVGAAGRTRYEEELRELGVSPPFIHDIGEGGIRRAPARAVYYPIRYLSDASIYTRPLQGYDPSGESRRREVIERALARRSLQASMPVVLSGISHTEPSVILALPVFAEDVVGKVSSEASSEVRGLIGGFVVMQRFVEAVLASEMRNNLQVRLQDVTDAQAPLLLYGESVQWRDDFNWQRTIEFGGRRWELLVVPTDAYLARELGWVSWWILMGCMLFVWISGALLLIITGREAMVREEVVEKTRQLREALSQAEAASSAKSHFLANMSHELRTPLNSIIGFTNRLLRRAPEEQRCDLKLMESLDIVRRNGEHLLALINDVLDVSKIEAGEMQLHRDSVAVAALFEELTLKVQPLLREKSLTYRAHIGEGVVALAADRRRLQQILLNLLSNAIKYTERGEVVLAAEKRVYQDRPGVEFSVTDTGIGIAVEDQPRLFRRFSQIDSHMRPGVEGTGLGLVLVKEFTEMHGGCLRLDSTPGEGSCFSVWLPAA